jgi:hypothetical protein
MTALRDLLEPRVIAGAELLDRHRPGWADRINLERLRMGSTCNCILGQEFAAEGRREGESGYAVGTYELSPAVVADSVYGFDVDTIEVYDRDLTLDDAYAILDELWFAEVRARRTPSGVTR